MAKAAKPVPEGYHTITPSLVLDNASQAIEWYKKALGAQEVSISPGPDGKIMHAELKIGDSRFMMNDAMMGAKGPLALGGSPASLWLFVEDSDALFNRAVGAGAQVRMPMADQFWGDRYGQVEDPFGHQWSFATHKQDLTKDQVAANAKAFFANMGKKSPEMATA